MKKSLLLLILNSQFLILNSFSQSPDYLWAKSADGVSFSVSYSCPTDLNGNIIVTGRFNSPTVIFGTTVLTNAGSDDIFIVKYDPIGNVIWAKSAGGTTDDEGLSCSTDASGNIIVTGLFQSAAITFGTTVLTNNGFYDMFIVKYDPSGNVLWAKSAGGTTADYGYGCATDASGNIIATGYFTSSTITFGTTVLANSGQDNIFIVKYDSIGNVLWAKSEGGIYTDEGYSCTTDDSGNIIVTGSFYSPTITFGTIVLTNANTYSDMFIVKYDSLGNVLWAKSAGGTNNDVVNSCSTDANGNIIAAGYFRSSTITFGTTVLANASGYTDVFIVKYDSGGNVLWAKSAGGTYLDHGYSCSTDASGKIILVGDFMSPTITFGTIVLTNADNFGTTFDMFIVKYDTGGNVLWAKSAGGNDFEQGFGCSTDATGNIIATGYFGSPSITFGSTVLTNPGMFIVKLDTTIVTGINDVKNVGNGVLVFPNPFSNSTTVFFSLSKSQNVSLKIFDVNGRLVTTLADKIFEAGEHQIEFNAEKFNAGIYFLQVQTAENLEIEKLIVTK